MTDQTMPEEDEEYWPTPVEPGGSVTLPGMRRGARGSLLPVKEKSSVDLNKEAIKNDSTKAATVAKQFGPVNPQTVDDIKALTDAAAIRAKEKNAQTQDTYALALKRKAVLDKLPDSAIKQMGLELVERSLKTNAPITPDTVIQEFYDKNLQNAATHVAASQRTVAENAIRYVGRDIVAIPSVVGIFPLIGAAYEAMTTEKTFAEAMNSNRANFAQKIMDDPNQSNQSRATAAHYLQMLGNEVLRSPLAQFGADTTDFANDAVGVPAVGQEGAELLGVVGSAAIPMTWPSKAVSGARLGTKALGIGADLMLPGVTSAPTRGMIALNTGVAGVATEGVNIALGNQTGIEDIMNKFREYFDATEQGDVAAPNQSFVERFMDSGSWILPVMSMVLAASGNPKLMNLTRPAKIIQSTAPQLSMPKNAAVPPMNAGALPPPAGTPPTNVAPPAGTPGNAPAATAPRGLSNVTSIPTSIVSKMTDDTAAIMSAARQSTAAKPGSWIQGTDTPQSELLDATISSNTHYGAHLRVEHFASTGRLLEFSNRNFFPVDQLIRSHLALGAEKKIPHPLGGTNPNLSERELADLFIHLKNGDDIYTEQYMAITDEYNKAIKAGNLQLAQTLDKKRTNLPYMVHSGYDVNARQTVYTLVQNFPAILKLKKNMERAAAELRWLDNRFGIIDVDDYAWQSKYYKNYIPLQQDNDAVDIAKINQMHSGVKAAVKRTELFGKKLFNKQEMTETPPISELIRDLDTPINTPTGAVYEMHRTYKLRVTKALTNKAQTDIVKTLMKHPDKIITVINDLTKYNPSTDLRFFSGGKVRIARVNDPILASEIKFNPYLTAGLFDTARRVTQKFVTGSLNPLAALKLLTYDAQAISLRAAREGRTFGSTIGPKTDLAADVLTLGQSGLLRSVARIPTGFTTRVMRDISLEIQEQLITSSGMFGAIAKTNAGKTFLENVARYGLQQYQKSFVASLDQVGLGVNRYAHVMEHTEQWVNVVNSRFTMQHRGGPVPVAWRGMLGLYKNLHESFMTAAKEAYIVDNYHTLRKAGKTHEAAIKLLAHEAATASGKVQRFGRSGTMNKLASAIPYYQPTIKGVGNMFNLLVLDGMNNPKKFARTWARVSSMVLTPVLAQFLLYRGMSEEGKNFYNNQMDNTLRTNFIALRVGAGTDLSQYFYLRLSQEMIPIVTVVRTLLDGFFDLSGDQAAAGIRKKVPGSAYQDLTQSVNAMFSLGTPALFAAAKAILYGERSNAAKIFPDGPSAVSQNPDDYIGGSSYSQHVLTVLEAIGLKIPAILVKHLATEEIVERMQLAAGKSPLDIIDAVNEQLAADIAGEIDPNLRFLFTSAKTNKVLPSTNLSEYIHDNAQAINELRQQYNTNIFGKDGTSRTPSPHDMATIATYMLPMTAEGVKARQALQTIMNMSFEEKFDVVRDAERDIRMLEDYLKVAKTNPFAGLDGEISFEKSQQRIHDIQTERVRLQQIVAAHYMQIDATLDQFYPEEDMTFVKFSKLIADLTAQGQEADDDD